MLYFLSAFIIFMLFLIVQRDMRTSVKYLVSTVFFLCPGHPSYDPVSVQRCPLL